MNNIIQTIRHSARAAAVLLIALCAAQTAWAEDVNYMAADGTTNTVQAIAINGTETSLHHCN